MSKYRCSQCGATYSFDEYRGLDNVSRVTDDPNDEYGIEKVCECGERFHSDKWQTVEEIEVNNREFRVSTVALTIPHGPNHEQWYETCVFWGGDSKVTDRYQTQEEAENGHKNRVETLRNEEFGFEPTGERLVIE